MENIAADAANRWFDRLFSVSSSMNFMRVARSLSSGSSAVAESFLLNLCNTFLMGLALLRRVSTAWQVNTLSLYSANVARFENSVSASSLIA